MAHMKKCKKCGSSYKWFYSWKSVYCSPSCRIDAKHDPRPGWSDVARRNEQIPCLACDEPFTVNQFQQTTMFCSPECRFARRGRKGLLSVMSAAEADEFIEAMEAKHRSEMREASALMSPLTRSDAAFEESWITEVR